MITKMKQNGLKSTNQVTYVISAEVNFCLMRSPSIIYSSKIRNQ